MAKEEDIEVIEPKEIKLDPAGRVHCIDGPAVIFEDGFGLYFVHDISVRKWMIEEKEKITVKMIDEEKNAETARVMREIYGWDRYLIDSGAKVVQEDEFGRLFRKEIPNDEPIVMVEVVNSSKEGLWIKEGDMLTFHSDKNEEGQEYQKKYMLRVPPTVKTAREAVASTFGLQEKQYEPMMQS